MRPCRRTTASSLRCTAPKRRAYPSSWRVPRTRRSRRTPDRARLEAPLAESVNSSSPPARRTATGCVLSGHADGAMFAFLASDCVVPALAAAEMGVGVCLQSWSQHTFPRKQPTGRQDALDLRAWLHSQLEALNSNTQGHLDKAGMLHYAEKAMDLYNAAFHELTRQARSNCSVLLLVCVGMGGTWAAELRVRR